MRLCRRGADMRAWSACYREAGLSIGLVPTLGGLHGGHVSLMERAREECDRVVVTIYLNPTQFNSPSDLASYPATLEEDLETCRSQGVDLVFLGRTDELLPEGFQSWVEVDELTHHLCGAFRPGHFRGVTTVVTQLLNIVRPHRAYFGLKDYQQAMVISRLVKDLLLDVEVHLSPTVREPDGLALSSRNARLDPVQREAASAIYRALRSARSSILEGETHVATVVGRLKSSIEATGSLRVEYAQVLDALTLRSFADGEIQRQPHGVLIAIAVYAGETRLIDNVVVEPRE